MGIDFSPERWNTLRHSYELWWRNDLDRPIVPVTLPTRDPGRRIPSASLLRQATCHDLNIDPADHIDRIDHDLSSKHYLGDRFPFMDLMTTGSGIAAALCGAELDNSSGRVWFQRAPDLPIQEIHLEYDPNNIWLNRIKDLSVEGRGVGKVRHSSDMTHRDSSERFSANPAGRTPPQRLIATINVPRLFAPFLTVERFRYHCRSSCTK